MSKNKTKNTRVSASSTQPTKWFVKISGDSGGEMFTPESVEAFDDFASAKARYRQLRLEEYLPCDYENDEDVMAEINRELDSLGEDDAACFEYENSDMDDENTFMNLTIELFKSNTYRTKTVYEV